MLIADKFSGYLAGRRLYPGKGSDAPAPDPRLIDAQVRSLGIQDEAIQYMIEESRNMAPQQREMMQDSIERSRVLWQQSQEDREFALGKRDQLSGVQNRIVQDAATFSAEDRGNQLAGQASADIAQTFDAARGQVTRDQQRMGVNPNDGRAMATQAQMATQQALASATGRNLARQQATQEGRQLTDRANNALAGYPAMSATSVGVGAGVSGMGQQALSQGQAGILAPSQAIISGAGAMSGNAGNIWGQQNSAYQQSMQNNAAAGQAAGSAVGALGTAAILAF